MSIEFVNLHNHTHFSILDSLISPKDLFERVKELRQTAVAITDHGTLSGIWDAYKEYKNTGVKLIVGCEFYFVDSVLNKEEKFRHVVLLAKNAVGYRNILTLNRRGFDNYTLHGNRVYSLIDWELLEKHSDGIICLTSCGNGIIGQLLTNSRFEEAESAVLRLKSIFNEDLGLEIQANNMSRASSIYNDKVEQNFINRRIIKLGQKHNIRIVPTTNSHYLKKEDADIHDVLLSIGAHQSIYSNFRLKYPVKDFYVKSGQEVFDFFARIFDESKAAEWCANTIYFANKCENPDWVDPKYSNPSGKELPEFPVKLEDDYQDFLNWLNLQGNDVKALEEDKQYLRYKCFKVFDKKVPIDKIDIYKARLNEELDVIEYHGFSSYMLIVADYINWARKNNISVGEGRGSVGGSLIAYLLDIHRADPIKYNLIFARFHNKEKSSFPDIDTDFAPSGREKVQNYIRNKYGEDHVAHVSNFNTITPKVYVRDICRSCELGGNKETAIKLGNDIADCIPAKDIHSIHDALEKVPLFSEYANKYPELKKYAEINGKYRAWSTHAGGIIISKRPLTGLVPLRKDKDGIIAIEYDKERAEENGLIKMDTLGLSTLDIIDTTYKLIKSAGKELPPDPLNYDEYDKKTYDLISKGDTFCVFQLGTSAGTIELCKQIKPKSIEDISHINSLARPSAKDIRNLFIQTKNGKRSYSLLHPSLNRAFGSTFGFGLYEESLMYLAQDVAGWSLNDADRLRKLTKEKGKNAKKVKQWREEFISDAVTKNNINEEIARKIWDDVIDKFQGYGFNMSHSILYSMLSYKTAYLKAHYPIEFLLANLMSELNSNSPDASKNISKIKQELRDRNVKIIPPDINKSQLTYSLVENNVLITGLDALKFVSKDAIEDIISKRPFTSFYDFMKRVDSSKVRSNTIQALISSGCLDSFNIPRKLMFLYCSDYRKKLTSWLKKHDPEREQFVYPWTNEDEWTKPELYALEKFYIGESFSCSIREAYGDFFNDRNNKCELISNIKKMQDKDKIKQCKAIIKSFFEFKIKKVDSKYYGQSMIKAEIEDICGDRCTLTIFPDRWEKEVLPVLKRKCGKLSSLDEGIGLFFSGTVNIYEGDVGIVLDNLYDCVSAPKLPSDLKARKVLLKDIKYKIDTPITSINITSDEIFEDIEDSLFDAGLIDLDRIDDC
jgi:DNA polymerase-3 subunit alpha